jgi:putative molybdopterin biosynthesis protein
LKSLDETREIMKSSFTRPKTIETIPVMESVGKCTQKPLYSSFTVPNTDVASMDGYAVCTSDVSLASDRNPVELVKGMRINTGNAIPAGYNAVVAIEDTYIFDGLIFTRKPVFPWQNIRKKGYEIHEHAMILPAGHLIRKSDIGPLTTYGVAMIDVASFSAALIPTGNELVSSGAIPGPGQVVESNTIMAYTWLRAIGAKCTRYPITGDQPELIREAITKSVKENDMIIISAGTSAGTRDFTAQIIADIGEVLVHGTAMIPGKPTIIGRVNGKPVIGLPGSPQAAQTVLRELIIPLCNEWGFKGDEDEQCTVRLSQTITSDAGFDEFVPLTIGKLGGALIASPQSRAPGVQRAAVLANGYIHIPRNIEGYAAGTMVEVNLTGKRREIERSLIISGEYHIYLDWLSNIMMSRDEIPLYLRNSGMLGGMLSLRKKACHATPLSRGGATGVDNIPFLSEYFDPGELSALHIAELSYGVVSRQPLETSNRDRLRFISRPAGADRHDSQKIFLEQYGIENIIPIQNIDALKDEDIAEAICQDIADASIACLATAKAHNLHFTPLFTKIHEILFMTEERDDFRFAHLIKGVQSNELTQHLRDEGFDISSTGRVHEIM